MRIKVSILLRQLSERIALTRDDFIKEYHSFSPKVHNVSGETVVSNVVEVGDKSYKVITTLGIKDIGDQNIVRVDFSTIELNKDTKKLQDIDHIFDYNLIKDVKKYIGYFKDVENIKPYYDEIMRIKEFRQLEPTFLKVLSSLNKLKDAYPKYEGAYEKINQVWLWLSHKMNSDSPEHMSPTLNVQGLSTKVFSSVILSIREGLKRLSKIYPKGFFHGFEIDSKKDTPNDLRRENIYSKLYEKFMPMILGSDIKYTKRAGPDGQLYIFDSPLYAKDIK